MLRQMLTKYKEALRGIYTEDSDADPGGDVLEDVDYDVLEELLADAYAGINGHAMGVARMQDTVRQWLRDNYIEQDFFQDNGTEQPTGPPAGQKENTAEHGGERYSLGEYSEHQKENWEASKRIVIYESPAQLTKFIEDSISNKTMGQKMYFGTITADLAERIKVETGLDVENYNLSLGSYEIRKILKDHGNEEREAPRGQRVVVPEDFENIVDVVLNPTKITRSDDDYMGKPAIQFTGTHNGRMNVVAVVSDKRLDLFVQTVFVNVKKEDLATPTGEQAPINTPEANSGTVFSNESIRNQIENVKQQIQAVLDKVSPNHAAQMERYTELKDRDPEAAQGYYDSLMNGPYQEQFEEYLKLTEELERLEGDSSADSTADGFVERASVDDSTTEDEGERIATPAEPARNDSGDLEPARNDSGEQAQTSDTEEQKDSYSTLPAKARDYVKRAERVLLNKIGKVLSVPYHARRDFLAETVRAITNEYLQNGAISKQTIDGLFEQAYAQGVVADEEFYKQYKHIKDHLRSTAVTLAEQDRSDIADFSDFKRRAGGLLKIRNEGGLQQ